jgi:hypothetical protein
MTQPFCDICCKPITTELHQVSISTTEPGRHFDFCGDCAFPVMLLRASAIGHLAT